MVSIREELKKQEQSMHELQFRDKIKSAEYHYAAPIEFDGFYDDVLIERLFEKIKLLSSEIDFSSFKLGVSWTTTDTDELMHLKYYLQTPLIKRIESELGKRYDSHSMEVSFLIDFPKKIVCVKISSVFVMGRYTKQVRDIAQTEFFCNKCRGNGCWYCKGTGHFSSESVEQLLGKVFVPAFEAKLLILHGAGREDMDVLMLGKGRPFVAELLMPFKRSTDLIGIEKKINEAFKGKISVNSLRICTINDVAPLKDTLHDKVYSAYVMANKPVDYLSIPVNKPIDVVQQTPTRVAKRRANLERKKTVTVLRVGEITKNEFVLVLRTSHGTYVKEFISGDNDRTNPSISSITGTHCLCMLLDVLEVCE
jgi:tRNA pseudouridine synthase 10